MIKISVAIGNRAEEGLTRPIRNRLRRSSDFELKELDVVGQTFGTAYEIADAHFKLFHPDMAFIPCDRFEILACALAAFFNNIPIAHDGGGDTEEIDADHTGTIRQMISLMSDVIFVYGEDRKAWLVQRGISPDKIFSVATTAFDDLVIDESLGLKLGKGRYDMVLYHPLSAYPEKMDGELREIAALIHDNKNDGIKTIWLKPNIDPGNEKIIAYAESIGFKILASYPREMFMGLMKNCRRFIGNSSAMIYEAPYFLKPKQIVLVGIRNKGREPPKTVVGYGSQSGSDQIVNILGRWDCEKKKVRQLG